MDNEKEVRGDAGKDHDLTVLKEDGALAKCVQGRLVFGEGNDAQVDHLIIVRIANAVQCHS